MMIRPSRMSFRLVPYAVLLVVLAGCTAARPSVATTDAPTGPPSSVLMVQASLAKIYASVSELLTDSDAVVVAQPVPSTAGELDGLPLTLTTMKSTKVVRGDLPTTFVLQQLGSTTTAVDGGSALPVAGRTYLLILSRFHLAPGDSTGRWVAVGDQGVFEVSNGDYVYRGAKYQSGGVGIPMTMSSIEMRSELNTSDIP